MSQLFDDLALLDRKIANRWKIRTRDNVRHVLSEADIDFIFADVIKSAQRLATATRNMASARTGSKKARMRANARNTRNCCGKSPWPTIWAMSPMFFGAKSRRRSRGCCRE